MPDFDLIRLAQEYVVTQLENAKPDSIDAFIWHQREVNALIEEVRLTVHLADQNFVFTFTEAELIQDYGTKEWETRLNERVKEILTEIKE